MAPYIKLADRIRQMIEDKGLEPGDTLPPERDLARQFGATYGTVRLANQLLIEQGTIDRQQGRGTFVTRRIAPDQSGRQRRLGLLCTDMHNLEGHFLRNLALSLQRASASRGYELAIEQFRIDELLQGKPPQIIEQKLVDGLLLYGAVREDHIQFIRQQATPYIVLGNTPLPPDVPQVRSNAEKMGYEITRELLQAGKYPIWIDADLSNTYYHTGLERVRGYAKAMSNYGDGATYLCKLKADRIMSTVETLARSDLRNAAYIVEDWSAMMLPTSLAMKSQDADQLLIVPIGDVLAQSMTGPNVVQWSRSLRAWDFAREAVNSIADVIEGQHAHVRSVSFETECRLMQDASLTRMQVRIAAKTNSPRPSRSSSRAAARV